MASNAPRPLPTSSADTPSQSPSSRFPYLLWIALGLSLLPIWCVKSGLVGELAFFYGFPSPYTNFGVYFVWTMFAVVPTTLLSIVFWIWTAPGRFGLAATKKSLVLWAVLCAVLPWQVYRYVFEVTAQFTPDLQEFASANIWLYGVEFLDLAILIGCGIWWWRRQQSMQMVEILWINWLLAVATIWSLRSLHWHPFGYNIRYICWLLEG